MGHPELQAKCTTVQEQLREFKRVIVALSAGVDSTLLAKLSRIVLGKSNVLAVTANSPSLAREELDETKRLALELDLQHIVVNTKELENPAYQANTTERCYLCKQELFGELEDLAASRGIEFILYGAIGDDAAGDRPGQRAASERGIRAPLQDVGLTKVEVREWARELGLSNWNRPQNACLSSRIPHGLSVTPHKLNQIEQAEAWLRAAGFRQVRVRHLGARVRIEVDLEAVHRFNDEQFTQEVQHAFEQFGLKQVVIAVNGYQMGGADTGTVQERSLVTPITSSAV